MKLEEIEIVHKTLQDSLSISNQNLLLARSKGDLPGTVKYYESELIPEQKKALEIIKTEYIKLSKYILT